MKDLGFRRFHLLILGWGILSWGFLIRRIWVWKFRSEIFGQENPVMKNRFEIVEGSGKWVDLDLVRQSDEGSMAKWFMDELHKGGHSLPPEPLRLDVPEYDYAKKRGR